MISSKDFLELRVAEKTGLREGRLLIHCLNNTKESPSSVRLIDEYGRLTIKAQPTRWSPIQVLTCTFVA